MAKTKTACISVLPFMHFHTLAHACWSNWVGIEHETQYIDLSEAKTNAGHV